MEVVDKDKLERKSHAVIDLLSDCSMTEKYCVLKALSQSFLKMVRME